MELWTGGGSTICPNVCFYELAHSGAFAQRIKCQRSSCQGNYNPCEVQMFNSKS